MPRLTYSSVSALATVAFVSLLPLPRFWILLSRHYPAIYVEQTSFNLYLSDVALFVIFCVAVIGWRTGRFPTPAIKIVTSTPLIFPLISLTILTALSLLWALDPYLTLYFVIRLLLLLALSWAILNLRPSPAVLMRGIWLMLVLQAVAAITQFVIQDDLGLRWLGELDLNRYPGGGSIILRGDQFWLRAYGITPHPNILGGFLAVACLLTVPLFLNERQTLWRWIWLIGLLIGTTGLMVSFSRAAWLGAIAGSSLLLLMLWLQSQRWQQYRRSLIQLVACMVGLILLLAIGLRTQLTTRLTPTSSSTETRSIEERGGLADVAFALIEAFPLTGVGAANFAVAGLPLFHTLPNVGPQPVHNVPLLLLSELGPLGGLLWLWLSWLPLGWLWLRRKDSTISLWTIALTAALCGYAVIDLFDYYAWGWLHGRSLRLLLLALWLTSIMPLHLTGAGRLGRQQSTLRE